MIKKLLFISFLLIATVGFSQKKSISKLSAAPNPFKNTTKIIVEANTKQAINLTIKNILGKTVYKKQHAIKKGKNMIPFSKNDLKTGMYIYTIQSDKEIISKRFVIK